MNEIIHLDSIYSQYVQPSNDCFNARFVLDKPIENASRIYLKSLEMAINFNNIRNVGTMNQIIMSTNLGNTYTVTIAQGNYTTMSSLLTVINNAFVGVIPSTTVTFSVSGNTISVSATSSTITSFALKETILSKYILGFRNVSFSGLTASASVNYVLNIDNYILMYINNVSSDNTSSNGNIFSSFKIPLNAINGVIYYYSDQIGLKQYIRLLNSTQRISYLNVSILDRFGNVLIANNSDYSFSLEIEKNINDI